MTQFCSAIYGLALAAMPAAAAHADVWDEAYDVSTRSRFIPMELILGAAWNGHRSINYPSGTFRQTAGGSTWKGPESWTHPVTGRRLTVYYRSRGGLNAADQVFAVRDDQAAIGRAGDSRFGIDACDQEGKYPLGIWKQGEMRTFHYTCWYDKKPDAKSRPSASRISISIAANGNTASASNGSCATTARPGTGS
ncbi:MAG: hypothetical protein QOJ96_1146 [Alphaproteobacteria bacterium]|jgi:hypothetical protein|nr:hypothetical protein [Alphaproteobacteria bacterium]